MQQKSEASLRAELKAVLSLLDESKEHAERTEWLPLMLDLLVVEDQLQMPLRFLANEGGSTQAIARFALWFLGSKADVAAMAAYVRGEGNRLVAPGLKHNELLRAIQSVQEALKLPADQFREEGVKYNRLGTKACVSVVVGKGAFNSEGWLLMFQWNGTHWELVWSRFHWIS